MPQPLLSICIPTFNRVGLLGPLLEQLQGLSELTFDYEVVICDNASDDGTAELIERYAQRLPIRSFRQNRNTGITANTSLAFRQARGRYCLYLADDDRLIVDALGRLMSFLQERPEIVVLHVPWLLWDEQGQQAPHPFYRLDEVKLFSPEQALDCFNFLVSGRIFPEIAIYRSDVLYRILHHPQRVYVGFLMLFRAFRYGSICFHPDSFYRFPLRHTDGATERWQEQEGYKQSVGNLDRYRGSLEIALLSALRELTPLPLDEELRAQALAMVSDFLLDRMRVACELSLARADFVAAHEFFQRRLLWRRDVAAAEVHEWENKFLPLAALQAAIEVQRENSLLSGLRLSGFTEVDGLMPGFGYFEDAPVVEVIGLQEAAGAGDRDLWVHLVEQPEQQALLVGAGMAPGQVLCFADLLDAYRILPRSFRR